MGAQFIKLIKKHFHHERFIVFAIILLLLPLYVFKLYSIPTSIHGDEAETALQALQIINGNVGLIGVGWFDLPLLSFLPHAVFMMLLGKSVVPDRLGSVIFGFLTLPVFYYFVKDFIDKKTALISLFLLGTSHLWLALSRVGITYVQSTFFILTLLFILFKAFRKNSKIYFLLSGIILGLSMYSNYAVRIIPLLTLICFIYYFLVNKKTAFHRKLFNFFIFWIAAAVIFLPQGIFYFNNPETFSSREKTIFIFSKTAREWTNYNLSDPQILLEQTKKTLDVFAGDNSTQYRYKGQLLDNLSIILLVIGILYSLAKINHFKYQFILFWLLLSLLGQILTSIPTPIFLPRFVVGLPVIYLLISIGLVFIFNNISTKQIYKIILLCLVLIVIILNNLLIYFIVYPHQVTGDLNARAATKISKILNNSYKDYVAYFYTEPYLYPDFATLKFLSPNTNRINQYVSSYNLTNSNVAKSIFIIYPSYEYLLTNLSSDFKNGKINEIRDIDGSVEFYTFVP